MTVSFNLFELLDLDPGPAEPDVARLRARLKERVESWSQDRVQGNPKRQRLAQASLDRLAEIEAVLEDDAQRREHAAAERKRLTEARRTAVLALDDAIEILRGSGRCDRKTVDRLVNRFSAIGRREIEKRLRDAGISLAAPRRRTDKNRPEPLDRRLMAEVRELLDLLGKENLYAFLGSEPQNSIRSHASKARDIYQENIRLGRGDAHSTAASELAGKCLQQIFVDDASKARYDAALSVEAMQALHEDIELAGADRMVTRDELDKLVEMARRRGVEADLAIEYIVRHGERKKWVVHLEEELPAETLQRCGFCLALNGAAADRCQECGEALRIACPRCKGATPSSASACARCGCRTGDAPAVHRLLTEGRHEMARGRLAKARAAFEQALIYWPDWDPATQALGELARRLEEQETVRTAIENLLDKAQILAARTRFESWTENHGRHGFEGLAARVRRELERADRKFAAAEAAVRSGRVEEGLRGFETCLEICADHAAARKALARHPPPPPQDLEVAELSAGYRLCWRPSAGRVTGYLVVRKAGGAPHDSGDGDLVGRVGGLALDDVALDPGIAWTYAVFAERAGIVSRSGSSSGPHRKLGDVRELAALAEDSQVTLSWRKPAGSTEVEIERLAVPGLSARKRRVAGESMSDRGLRNGVTLRYRATALFPPLSGSKPARSRGRLVEVTPRAPHPPVLDLEIQRDGRRVVAAWTPVRGARVELRRRRVARDTDPAKLEGRVVTESVLEDLGKRIPATSPGQAEDLLTGQDAYFFIPVTLGHGQAVIGRAARVTWVDSVQNLSYRMASGALALSWVWPDGIDRVRVCWAYDGPVAAAEQHRGPQEGITRQAYARRGFWRLARPEPTVHYFSVFAESAEGHLSRAAQTVAGLGREVAVRYRLVSQRAGWRRRLQSVYLELVAEEEIRLPAVVALAKDGTVPISAQDGLRVADSPACHLKASVPQRVDIPETAWSSGRYFKLFFLDSAESAGLRLLPAAQSQLRLG